MKKKLFGVLFFFLLVLVTELVLGLFHLEKHDHLFLQRSSHPFFIPGSGEHADEYVTNPHFSYQLNSQTFPRSKKAGVKRIFILGGSAAYGWPYGEEYGFSGYLRRALNGVTSQKFEIIDAAGMSFGSHRVLDELRDIVLYEPDLVIIFCGNNEYVEKNILPTSFGQENSLEQLSGVLGRTATYRAVRLGLFAITPKSFQRPVARDMTDIRSDTIVRRAGMDRTSATEQEVLANFRNNLQAMRLLLAAKGIKGIFCTEANNVAGWAPQNNPPKFASQGDYQKWLALQNEITAGLATAKPANQDFFTRLARLLQESLRVSPDYASNLYNLGRVELAMGRYADGYATLLKARDLDSRPIRALSSFNESVRTVVKGSPDVTLADIEETVGQVIRSGFTEGIYLDYCHFTLEGNKFVAITLLPIIQQALGLQLPQGQLEDYIHNDPISPANDRRLMAIELYARGMTYKNNGMYAEARDAFTKVLAVFPADDPVFRSGMMDNLASSYNSLGQSGEAKRYYLLALDTDPANTAALLEVGRIYLAEGKLEQAAGLFQRLLKVNAYSPDAYEGLGHIAQRQGKGREALSFYDEALKLGGGNAEVYKGMAKAHADLGENERSRELLLKAREFEPFGQ